MLPKTNIYRVYRKATTRDERASEYATRAMVLMVLKEGIGSFQNPIKYFIDGMHSGISPK